LFGKFAGNCCEGHFLNLALKKVTLRCDFEEETNGYAKKTVTYCPDCDK
jgi:hypothetical protein